jgi:hypothetical protein
MLIEYADTLRILEVAARDMSIYNTCSAGVRTDLENFANACRAEIQHREIETGEIYVDTRENADLL